MPNQQQDLFTDLPRGEQLALLRELELPTYAHKSGKVSGANGTAGCFTSSRRSVQDRRMAADQNLECLSRLSKMAFRHGALNR